MFVCNIALVKLPLNIFIDNVYPQDHNQANPYSWTSLTSGEDMYAELHDLYIIQRYRR